MEGLKRPDRIDRSKIVDKVVGVHIADDIKRLADKYKEKIGEQRLKDFKMDPGNIYPHTVAGIELLFGDMLQELDELHKYYNQFIK